MISGKIEWILIKLVYNILSLKVTDTFSTIFILLDKLGRWVDGWMDRQKEDIRILLVCLNEPDLATFLSLSACHSLSTLQKLLVDIQNQNLQEPIMEFLLGNWSSVQ